MKKLKYFKKGEHMTGNDIRGLLATIRCEVAQLDFDRQAMEETNSFVGDKKKAWDKRYKQLKKKLDIVEFKLIPNMKKGGK